MVNTHNLKMVNLDKASEETCNWKLRSGGYTEIFYNMETGEVWTVDQVDIGHNSYTVYHDPEIIKIGETERKMTEQQIADAIFRTIEAGKAYQEMEGK